MKAYLEEYGNKNTVSFHMPGHKGYKIFDRYGYGNFFRSFVDWDITEIPGADNLFHPEGIIKKAMENYKNLYQSQESYLLINGTSSGIIGAMLAVAKAGQKILAARNCHKSVHSGATLGAIEMDYVYPSVLGDGILGPILPEDIEAALAADSKAKEWEQIKAVILPSPNYYGICSDIEAIAKVAHKYGKVLIVDQAHGAHLKFFNIMTKSNLPKSAEEQGADIVINSIHKTLASFTQSAVINLMSDRVDKYVLEEKLALVQSTSPSYVLMAGLSVNSEILINHGTVLMGEWQENIEFFYEEAKKIKGLKVITNENLDSTKLNLDFSAKGINGSQLESLLMGQNIYSEFYTGDILMCMSGIGNCREDFVRLLHCLKEISETHPDVQVKPGQGFYIPRPGPKGQVSSLKKLVNLKDSAGLVSARMIIPYPPGIPFICPGEVITEEIVNCLIEMLSYDKLIFGIDEGNQILIYK
ncbi:MAG: aminotransferase class I/II-fold pyridoxal phosphate-dependent enzyme [Anaerovoracaceae bacterium]